MSSALNAMSQWPRQAYLAEREWATAGAAVAVGIQQGLLAEEVRVELPGGRLDIAWKGPGHPLYMTGPAVHVYDGFIHL